MEENVEDDELFEVECFLNTRKMSDGIRYYKVRWKGYPPEEDSWEPEGNVKECTEALDAFWSKRQKKKKKRQNKTMNVNQKEPKPSSRNSSISVVLPEKPLGLTRQATKEILKARHQYKQSELPSSSQMNVMTSSEDMSSGADSCDIITVNSPPDSERNTDVETIEIMSQGSASDIDQGQQMPGENVPVISLLSDSESDHAKEGCETPDIQSPEFSKKAFNLNSLGNIKDNEILESNECGHITEGTGFQESLTPEITKNKFVGYTKEGFEIPELPPISENAYEYSKEGFEIPKEYFIASTCSFSSSTQRPECLGNLQTAITAEEGLKIHPKCDESLQTEHESGEITKSACFENDGVEIPQLKIPCTSSTPEIPQETDDISIDDTNEPGIQSPTFERQTFTPNGSKLLAEDETTPQSKPLKHTETPKCENVEESSVDPSSCESTPRSKKRFNLSLQKKNRKKRYEYLEAKSISPDIQESEVDSDKDQTKLQFKLEDLREQMAELEKTDDSQTEKSMSVVDMTGEPQSIRTGKDSAKLEELKGIMLKLANEQEKEAAVTSDDRSGSSSSISATQFLNPEPPTLPSSVDITQSPPSSESLMDSGGEEVVTQSFQSPESTVLLTESVESSQVDTTITKDTMISEVIVSGTEKPSSENSGVDEQENLGTIIEQNYEIMDMEVNEKFLSEGTCTTESSEQIAEEGLSQTNTVIHQNIESTVTMDVDVDDQVENSQKGFDPGKGFQVNTLVEQNNETIEVEVVVSETEEQTSTPETSKESVQPKEISQLVAVEPKEISQLDAVVQRDIKNVDLEGSESEVLLSANTHEACQEVGEDDLKEKTEENIMQIDESNETIINENFTPFQQLDTSLSKPRCDEQTDDILSQPNTNETTKLQEKINVIPMDSIVVKQDALKDIQAELLPPEPGLDADITDVNKTDDHKIKSGAFEAVDRSEQVSKASLSHGKIRALQKLKSFAAKLKPPSFLSRSNSVASNLSVSSDDGKSDLGTTVNIKDCEKMDDINDQNIAVESSGAQTDDDTDEVKTYREGNENFIRMEANFENDTNGSFVFVPNTNFSNDSSPGSEHKQKETNEVDPLENGGNAADSSNNEDICDSIIILLPPESETTGEEFGKMEIEGMQLEESGKVGSDSVSDNLTQETKDLESHLEKVTFNKAIESTTLETTTVSNNFHIPEMPQSPNNESRQNTSQITSDGLGTNAEKKTTKKKKKIMKKSMPRKDKDNDVNDVVKEKNEHSDIYATEIILNDEGTLDSLDISEVLCPQDSSINELNNNSELKKNKLNQNKKRIKPSSSVAPEKKKRKSLIDNNKQKKIKASQKRTTFNKQLPEMKKSAQENSNDKSTNSFISADIDAPPDLDNGDLIGKILDEGDMVDSDTRFTKSSKDKKVTDAVKDGGTADEEDELDFDLDEFPIENLLDDEISELKDIPSPPVTPIEVTYGDLKQFIRDGDEMNVRAALKGGTELNVLDGASGMTLLMLASAACQDNIVELLLRRQADVNAVQKNGMTALMHACEQGCPETAHLLLMCGADINKQQIAGETALMKACKKGHNDVVEVLLKHGASTKVKTKAGQTASQLALPSPCEEIQVLLQEHEKRLSKAVEEAITTCLGDSVMICKPPILAYQCVAPRESNQFTFPFQYTSTQLSSVKKDIMLFCIKANFTDDAVSLLFGEDNGVRGVLLNAKSQIPLLRGIRSIFSIEPKKGNNTVTIQTHKSSSTSKVIICIYAIQAS